MTCEKAIELLSGHLDGVLTPEEETELQAHLDHCEDCRGLLKAWTAIDDGLKDLEQPAPEGLARGVMVRIKEQQGIGKPKKRRFFGPGTGLGAVAAILVLLIGTGVIKVPAYGGASAPGKSAEEAPLSTSVAAFAPPQLHDNGDETPANADTKRETAGFANGLETALLQIPETKEAGTDGVESAPVPASTRGMVSDLRVNQLRAVDPALADRCEALSCERSVPVLVYTEFDDQSFLSLLADAQPELYERLLEGDYEVGADGVTICTVEYRTMLAVQEWLMQNLTRTEDMDPEEQQGEFENLIRFEALDPGSQCLTTVITWNAKPKPISWPAQWPENWMSRVRLGDNWALFFPSEDFKPLMDDPAVIVFAAQEEAP